MLVWKQFKIEILQVPSMLHKYRQSVTDSEEEQQIPPQHHHFAGGTSLAGMVGSG